MNKKKIRVSVRDIVGFSENKGHIEKGRSSVLAESAWEGTVLHSEIQKKMNEEHGPEKFKSEVFLKDEIENDEIILTVSGRIDGLLEDEDTPCIYEIKSTAKNVESIDIEQHPAHWGQAICYGYIYSCEKETPGINIRLIYINRETKDTKEFIRYYDKDDLECIYSGYVGRYLAWMSSVRQ